MKVLVLRAERLSDILLLYSNNNIKKLIIHIDIVNIHLTLSNMLASYIATSKSCLNAIPYNLISLNLEVNIFNPDFLLKELFVV